MERLRKEITNGLVIALSFILLLLFFPIIESVSSETKRAIEQFVTPIFVYINFPDVEPYLIVIGIILLTVWKGPAVCNELFGQKTM
ncbi:MAG: hypothetical protein ACP5NX_01595 [Candidatus Bilamarchaeaceae archaeon]